MFTNPTFTGTVSGVTKSMVGLGNVQDYGISDSINLNSSASYASSKAVNDSNVDVQDLSGMPTVPPTIVNIDSYSWGFLRVKTSRTKTGQTIKSYQGSVDLGFTSSSPSYFSESIDLNGFVNYDLSRASKVMALVSPSSITDYNLSITYVHPSIVTIRGSRVATTGSWPSIMVRFLLEDIS